MSLRSLLGGFRFVLARPRHPRHHLARHVRGVPGGAPALFPIFARDILQTGPWGLGLLRAAPASARW